MNIVILTDQVAGGGGAGVVAWNQAIALRDRGYTVSVISTTPLREDHMKKVVYEGITSYFLYAKPDLRWRTYRSLWNPFLTHQLSKLLKDIRPDIIHVHNVHLYFSYYSFVVARKYSKALFFTAHDSMSFHYSKLFPGTVQMDGSTVKSYKVSQWTQCKLFRWQYLPLRNWLIRKYLKIPTKIFAVSSALAQALQDNGIENVEVLHNGIDVKEWGMKGKPVADSKDHIFFGGRLSRAKGGTVLVEALAEIFPTHPQANLLVVGEQNAYTKELEKKLGDLAKDHLVLTGARPHSQMKGMYAQCLLVVVPSLCFDWFPTNILEAMASGKPVIATCFGGSREMVADGKTGFIIDPRDISELKKKLLFILDNPRKAEEMGKAGYERVQEEFSMDMHMEKLLAWYDKTLADSKKHDH